MSRLVRVRVLRSRLLYPPDNFIGNKKVVTSGVQNFWLLLKLLFTALQICLVSSQPPAKSPAWPTSSLLCKRLPHSRSTHSSPLHHRNTRKTSFQRTLRPPHCLQLRQQTTVKITQTSEAQQKQTMADKTEAYKYDAKTHTSNKQKQQSTSLFVASCYAPLSSMLVLCICRTVTT